MNSLQEALAGVTRIGIDTSPFIYLLETHPLYFPLVDPLFKRLDEGEFSAATSTITLAEVTVLPLRLRLAKCDTFVTNDRTLKQVTDIPVLVLNDLLGRNE